MDGLDVPDAANRAVMVAVTDVNDDAISLAIGCPAPEPKDSASKNTPVPRSRSGRDSPTVTERKVFVADDLDGAQQITTVLHELAHIALGHKNRRDTIGREVREVEAESVAYLVGHTIGLDCRAYAVPYIGGWARGDTEPVESTAQQVLAATKELIDTLERELGVQLVVDATPVLDIKPTS